MNSALGFEKKESILHNLSFSIKQNSISHSRKRDQEGETGGGHYGCVSRRWVEKGCGGRATSMVYNMCAKPRRIMARAIKSQSSVYKIILHKIILLLYL
jgi:hypothetical protein